MAYAPVPVTSKNVWDFDPTTIGGCTLWLDGADPNTMFSDIAGTSQATTGGNVLRWNDKSISRVSATQNVNASYPSGTPATLTTDSNGKNTLNFQATGCFMLPFGSGNTSQITSNSILTVSNQNLCVYSVGQQVTFSSSTNGITAGTIYYIASLSAVQTNPFTMTISLTQGGAAITTLTNATSGSIAVSTTFGSNILPTGVSNGTYFFVTKNNGTGSDLFNYGNFAGSNGRRFFFNSSSQFVTNLINTGGTNHTYNSSINGVITIGFTNYTTQTWFNGTSGSGGILDIQPSAPGFTTGNNIGLIGAFMGGGNAFNGTISEILVYTTALSNTDRQTVEGYLAWKWGLQSALPASHPYSVGNIRPFSRNFVPTDISNCIMWYDGADMSSMFQNTGGTTPVTGTTHTIALWRDKSGSGNNLTSASGPTYTATTSNPCGFDVRFNGTSQFMSNTALVNNSNTYTKFLVFQRSTIASDFCRLFAYATVGEQSNNDPTGFHIQAGGSGTTTIHQLYKSNAGSGSLTITNNTYILATIVANPLTMSLFFNGSLTATATVGPLPNTNFNATRFFLARTTAGGFQFFPGIINEVISYNRQLSTYEYQEVEGYLAWKWGLHSSLPTTHPFYRFPTPSVTPIQPELQLYKPQFDPSDLNPTIWLDASDSTTLTTSNNRVTSIVSKGSQSLTLSPPNLPFSLIIPSGTTVPTGGTGTTFTLNGTVLGAGTLSGITVTVGGTAIPNCTLIGGSPTLTTGSSVTISNGAAVTAATYSITLQASTTIPTGATGTSFTMNLAPTGTGTFSGVPLVIGGAYVPNCTVVGGSTTLTTGASTTIANGATVLVQPGPILNTATRGTGLSRPYMDFSSGGNFSLSAASIGNYNSTAITITANSVYLDRTTIIISSSPAVTLTLNQPIVFSGSGTVIPGTTNIVAGTTYFIRAVTIFSNTNTNFPTFAVTLATSSGGTAITGLTAGTLTGVTATAGAYLLTMTTSIVHNIPNGSPIALVMDSSSPNINGAFFGNVQSVPSTTQLTMFVTSSSTTITTQTLSQLVGHIQYGNNPIIGGSLASDATTLTLTTAMPHNLQVGHVVQPYFAGPSLPSQWSPYTAATVYSSNPSNPTFTGYISATFGTPGTSGQLLTVTTGTPPAVGAILSGTGISAGTYVSGVSLSGTNYYVNTAQNVTSTTITSTYSYITFVANLSGTTLTYVSGTVPSLGMVLFGTGIAVGTYIVSGASPTFTLSTSVTTGTSIAITASNYAVEIQLPSTNWPPLPGILNNSGTASITSSSGTIFSGSNLGLFATVGQVMFLTSAVGSVPAGAYYVASKLDNTSITLARSRDLTTIVTPGTTSGINVVLYNPSIGLRFCSAGTSSISTLNFSNGNSALVGADYTNNRITVSGFMVTPQPASGTVNMALVANPGIQASGSGSFAVQYIYGTCRVLSIPTTTSLTISLPNRGSSTYTSPPTITTQSVGSVTYTGLMANYGFTDFRFGGNGLGNYSFGGWNPTQPTQTLQAYTSTITQAYLSYPAIGCILEASGSNVTNAFNSTTATAVIVAHSTTTPLRSTAQNGNVAPSLLSTAVTSGILGGTNTTSGGRDFAILPSQISQGLGVQFVQNNTTVNFRPGNTIDWTSGYRIFSAMFNSTGSAMGDVATLTRYLTIHGWRCDTTASFANNTGFFGTSAIASNTSLAPTVLRLGASPSVIGYGIDPITYCDMGISEILIFNTPLTLEQRQLVEGFLSQKYACQYILANQSSTVSSSTFIHPYRANPVTIAPSLNLSTIYAQGLAAWFDAANSSTIGFVSSNNINSWTTAGGSFSLTLVPNGTNYPTLVQNAQNGLPGVRFTVTAGTGTPLGTSHNLPITNFSTMSANNEYTIITVYRQPTYSANQTIAAVIGTANQRLMTYTSQFSYRNSTTEQLKNYTATTSGQTYIGVHYRRGNTMLARVNGTQDAGSSTAGTNLNLSGLGSIFSVSLGAYSVSNPSGIASYAGDIYEHMIFRYALTDQAIYQIEGYLAWKWGLQTSLPTTHPYSRVRP